MRLALLTGFTVLLLSGCAATNKHYVVASTGTVLGIEIAQNPASQMYQAKLGYGRSELAIVPSNRSTGTGDTVSGNGAKDTTDVVMELHYNNIFNFSSSGIYQRLAVGSVAVTQPGASLMFSKDKNGAIDPQVAAALSRNIAGVKESSSVVTSLKMPLADVYAATSDKTKLNAIAVANGYSNFAAFLAEANTSADKVSAVARAIQESK